MADSPGRHQIPVLLVRTGESRLTAIARGEQGSGWAALPLKLVKGLAVAMETTNTSAGQTNSERLSARSFTMHPEDIAYWDNMKRYGTGGYSFGTLWGKEGKIAKNVRWQEATPGQFTPQAGNPSAPLADATAIVNAVALAQVAATLEGLTERIEELQLDLASVMRLLHLEQEAEALAAVETVADVHEQYRDSGSVGSVNWDRIAEVEQPLQRLHRQIIGELRCVGRLARLTSITEARGFLRVDVGRVADLLDLEEYVIHALAQWTELYVAAQCERDESQSHAAHPSSERLQSRMDEAREAIEALSTANGQLPNRGAWERLRTHGFIGGALKDRKTRRKAMFLRHKVNSVASRHRGFSEEAILRPSLVLVA